eukprot:6479594-Amphidinium_carterae.2
MRACWKTTSLHSPNDGADLVQLRWFCVPCKACGWFGISKMKRYSTASSLLDCETRPGVTGEVLKSERHARRHERSKKQWIRVTWQPMEKHDGVKRSGSTAKLHEHPSQSNSSIANTSTRANILDSRTHAPQECNSRH